MKSNFTLSLLVFLSILLVYFFYHYQIQQSPNNQSECLSSDLSSNIKGLIVFKLPRSGSTFFTELLNSFPSIHLAKEIVQKTTIPELDSSFHTQRPTILSLATSQLKSALSKPYSKLWIPSSLISALSLMEYHNHWLGRFKNLFIETFLISRNLFLSTKVLKQFSKNPSKFNILNPYNKIKFSVGYTINPENTRDLVDWSEVVTSNPLQIIYIRSNIVKGAISSIRGKLTKSTCGVSNLVEGSTCRIPKKFTLDYDQLIDEILFFTSRYKKFISKVQEINSHSNSSYIVVSYEDVMYNTIPTLVDVITFLDLNASPFEIKNFYSSFSSMYSKRTSDYLKESVINFDQIEKLFSSLGNLDPTYEDAYDCSILSSMLQEHQHTTRAKLTQELGPSALIAFKNKLSNIEICLKKQRNGKEKV